MYFFHFFVFVFPIFFLNPGFNFYVIYLLRLLPLMCPSLKKKNASFFSLVLFYFAIWMK